MRENSVVHQALLRPPFAHIYPGIVPNEWQPADVMLEVVKATVQRRTAAAPGIRGLDPVHFAFRGTPTDGAKQVARELRRMGRKR
jgi:hypothetical protein